jgi:hypothetical protein
MVAYIDQHRDEFGVESICRVLRSLRARTTPPNGASRRLASGVTR